MIQKHELAKEAKVISADNNGSFYKFVNNRLTCSTGIATLKYNAGNAVNCLKGVATLVQGLVFFCERVVNAWNSLPRDTNFNSVAGYKTFHSQC